MIRTFLSQRIDGASLGVFRLLFGCLLTFQIADYFVGGHMMFFAHPTYRFVYPLLPVPSLPATMVYALFGALFLSALCIAAGFLTRAASVIFFLGYTWVFFFDRTLFLNHYYLVWLLSGFLCVTHVNRFLSIDQLFRPKETDVPAWHLYLFRFQVAVAYFFAALAKLNTDWLVRNQPIASWFPDAPDVVISILTYGGLLVTAFTVPALLYKPTRKVAVAVSILFHLTNSLIFSLGIFPWLMIALTLLFLAPSWPRRFFSEPVRNRSRLYVLPRPVFVALTLFAVLQVTLPLRHYFCSGNVSWNECGRTFAWQMKGRDKQVLFTLYRQMEDSISVEVDLHAYLTQHQIYRMAERPELLTTFAKDIAQDGEGIFADASASLNGRPFQPYIRPDIDLVTVEDPFSLIEPL